MFLNPSCTIDILLFCYSEISSLDFFLFVFFVVIELVALRDAEVYRSLAQKLLPNVLHPLPISMAALLKDYTKKLVILKKKKKNETDVCHFCCFFFLKKKTNVGELA